jgi:hypothetical protein
MFPNEFEVDPGWYDAYWYSDRPRPKRRTFAGSLARFAVLAVLLAGSGVALSYFEARSDASGAHDWEQE